jgi:hypothetical protein
MKTSGMNMEHVTPEEMLNALQAEGHQPCAYRRLEGYYIAIEACRAAGYCHKAIHSWLLAKGIKMSFKYYQRAFARMRKARTAGSNRHSTAVTPAAVHAAPTEIRAGSTKEDRFIAVNKTEPDELSPTIAVEPQDAKQFSWDAQAASKTDWTKF